MDNKNKAFNRYFILIVPSFWFSQILWFVIDIDIHLFLEKIDKKNIKINTININYKTISIILNNKEYQITSFRKDLISFGRSAIVDFTFTLHEDAKRRDFTINALYLDEKGNLIDPFGGYNDIMNKKLRFIGDPISRIEEDHLRILRFSHFINELSKEHLIYLMINL